MNIRRQFAGDTAMYNVIFKCPFFELAIIQIKGK